MPVYTIYHRPLLPDVCRETVANELTDLHSVTTGAPRQSVKVIFVPLDRDSFFSGGERKENYVRVVAQIRRGRTEEQKMAILRGMFEIVQASIEMSPVNEEIQTQIIEIDDTKTFMTNGILNV